MIVTKIMPESPLIPIILAKPTPATPKAIDEDSASIPMNGKTIMANMKHIIKFILYFYMLRIFDFLNTLG